MSEKKCKLCGADAEWVLDGGCYCEFCARLQLDVHGICAPQACATCNNPLGRVYYTDDENNAFCMDPIIRPPDSVTKRYVIYIVRYVGHDCDLYTREYCTPDKEDAIRVAKGYRESGRRVAVCEETRTIKTLRVISDTRCL